ncbi:aromatic-ring-hydroxylating dioxygenase subunit beta [Sphingomonas bisphenolicum]|uniref:Aromatic-ring-hydroxylating dioxygenase subunit beta n=1 Tax=Sphingomonas bisphenolicum TaxID=296544 RepID=A0ABN5WBY9_9SPHN|nr:aromatic-ring-hydroxylating dioxygenase subunit beta [Sphingomonas bisphenolicum]BBF69799.1 aromatic-ring-hydroxylating dioxygenase subunit beta [Sphingomonas bisphenolicum]
MDTMTMSKVEAVSNFLYGEAQLLDDKRFHEWLALFDDDGYYWVPVDPQSEERLASPSIFDADKPFLEIIVNRLYLDTAYSFLPAPRCCRFVSNITILNDRQGVISVRSKLLYDEYRTLEAAPDDHRSLAGTVHHELARKNDGFVILSKRVDLIQSAAALSAISAPI